MMMMMMMMLVSLQLEESQDCREVTAKLANNHVSQLNCHCARVSAVTAPDMSVNPATQTPVQGIIVGAGDNPFCVLPSLFAKPQRGSSPQNS